MSKDYGQVDQANDDDGTRIAAIHSAVVVDVLADKQTLDGMKETNTTRLRGPGNEDTIQQFGS